MRIFKGWKLTFIAVIGLALIIGLSVSSSLAAGPRSGLDVTVINTPLPVRGMVSIDGPLSISGTPDVNVTNTAATPVLIRDVDNAAMQPFQQELLLSTPDGLLGAGDEFTVPDGKRLVIEFVSFDGTWPAGQHTTRLFINVSNASGNVSPTSFYLAPSFETTEFGGNVFFAASSPTRLYADPGTEVSVDVRRNTPAGTGLATVAISGYLVDVP